MTNNYPQARWSLDDLFPKGNMEAVNQAFTALEQGVAAFETHRPELTADISSQAFLNLLQESEELYRQAHHLYNFASLWFAEDTQSQEAQTLLGRVEQFFATLENRTLFFSLWWKALDDENAARLLAASGDYHAYLEAMRKFKPHTLSEPEEQIINLKNVSGIQALQRLYDTITNRYVFKVQVDGETKELTRGELMALVRTPDADLRARAYQELYRVYGEDGALLGQVYQTIVRDWYNENITLRKFATPNSARNLHNDLPDAVVDTLLDVCRQNAPLFQRYFRLKARHLGMDTLRRYDIYAPVSQTTKTYTFDQAANLVFEAYQCFSPRMAALARQVFDENHLDSEVRKGKRSGAFCATASNKLTPWVLVNYQGRPDDVATLAHELGHAVHSLLAQEHTLFTQHPVLPLAETASTFGEMLLVDYLLDGETDPSVRRDLLFRQVDDAYATIMRQAFFAQFERQAHELVRQGASVDALSQAYMENLQTQFGDSLQVADEFRWEWVSIPHIYHVPFYVYAYAFGQLLVLSLYQQYRAESETFKPRYLSLLAAGGSQSPLEILDAAGIDARQAEFWQGGFDVIAGLLDQLESLS
ncbi:MAG: M3 family oligoendopeptidase [Anaerolineales bacterium]